MALRAYAQARFLHRAARAYTQMSKRGFRLGRRVAVGPIGSDRRADLFGALECRPLGRCEVVRPTGLGRWRWGRMLKRGFYFGGSGTYTQARFLVRFGRGPSEVFGWGGVSWSGRSCWTTGVSSSGHWNAGRSGVKTWSAQRGWDVYFGASGAYTQARFLVHLGRYVEAGFSVGAACRARANRAGPSG